MRQHIKQHMSKTTAAPRLILPMALGEFRLSKNKRSLLTQVSLLLFQVKALPTPTVQLAGETMGYYVRFVFKILN